MTATTKQLAVIAGDGTLPSILVNRLTELKLLSLLIVLQGNADRFKFPKEMTFEMAPGAVAAILELLEKNGIEEIIMIGKIDKRAFVAREQFDDHARELVKRLNDGKDLNIFHLVLAELNRIGIEIIPQDRYLATLLLPEGVLTDRILTEEERADVIFGMDLAKKTATLDIGQTVIVKNGTILAVEAIEGTDEAIKRGGQYGNGGAVVCKAARENQDPRFDIPTIGVTTIETMSRHGCAVLAGEAGKIFIADREAVLQAANRRGIAIMGV